MKTDKKINEQKKNYIYCYYYLIKSQMNFRGVDK